MTPRKTAVVGGSFNPVHNGHLFLADILFTFTDYTRIIYVPVNIPSHKEFVHDVTALERVSMLQLAVDYYMKSCKTVYNEKNQSTEILVDDCDIKRGGISYTYFTICSILERYNVLGKPAFFIGDDLLQGLPTWYNWKKLRNMITFVVASREQKKISELRIPSGAEIVFLENAIKEVSSSRIRKLLQEGKSIADLVPKPVERYIRDNGLYKNF